MKRGSPPAFIFQLTKWRGNVGAARDQVPVPRQGPTHWSKELFLLSGKMQRLISEYCYSSYFPEKWKFLCQTQGLSLGENRFQFVFVTHEGGSLHYWFTGFSKFHFHHSCSTSFLHPQFTIMLLSVNKERNWGHSYQFIITYKMWIRQMEKSGVLCCFFFPPLRLLKIHKWVVMI